MEAVIRAVTNREELRNSARVIRRSFRTVAVEFGLTRENCPAHPSFQTLAGLIERQTKQVVFFGQFLGEKQIGFVAMERADQDTYYLERLAVLPERRHHGCGAALVDFVLRTARQRGAARVSLSMIDEHTVLREWYKRMGFVETVTRRFEHLPFTVCYMERELADL